MSAGIASVTRMIERLDPILKRAAASNPDSSVTGGTSNVTHKGKSVQENVVTQSWPSSGNNGEMSNALSPDASSLTSVASSDRVEVFPSQVKKNLNNSICLHLHHYELLQLIILILIRTNTIASLL